MHTWMTLNFLFLLCKPLLCPTLSLSYPYSALLYPYLTPLPHPTYGTGFFCPNVYDCTSMTL